MFNQRLSHLLDEEWIPLCFAVDGFGKFIRNPNLSKQSSDQGIGFIDGETSQLETFDQPLSIPLDQGISQGMAAIEFDLTVRANDQQAPLAKPA